MTDFLTEYFSQLGEGLLHTLKEPGAYLNKAALTAVVLVITLALNLLIKKLIKRNVSDFKKRLRLKKTLK